MMVRIGFVGSARSEGLGAEVGLMVPAGTTCGILSITEAKMLIRDGLLTVLVIALDEPDWLGTLHDVMGMPVAGQDRPLAVLGLVPRDDPAALVTAFELGVADVAGMPVEPQELRARLAALIRRHEAAFVRAAETQAAMRMAVIDPVTGLFNRYHLNTVLPAAIDNARSSGQPLALLMIDLDALKPFNDRWGHAAGDRVLRSVADALRGSMRASDIIARYGGDEIAVVMPDTDVATARVLASRLVRVVAATRVGRAADGPVGVTVSVGMATLTDGDGEARDLVIRADAALYEAKRCGRNRVAEAA